MRIVKGIPEDQILRAAALYWEAFRSKLSVPLGPKTKALSFIAHVMRPDHAICALDDAGRLCGVVGYKTASGAFVGGQLSDLMRVYGRFGGIWRGLLLETLERDVENERFIMDGIFVADEARGQGIGTALLHSIYEEAAARGYPAVRLEVIDRNTRARALYEREGFTIFKTTRMGPLKHIFGFGTAFSMERSLIPNR